jgi:transcriptional regulator with XRE-family HTH domain
MPSVQGSFISAPMTGGQMSALRISKGLLVAGLAARLGLDASVIRAYESGAEPIPTQVADAVTRVVV